MYSTQNVRGEHLLWLTPLLYIWITSINAPIQNFIVYYDGDFYLFNYLITLCILLVLFAIPFYIHHYIRANDLRNIVVSWVHIAPTLILTLSFITIYAYAPPIEMSWKNEAISNPNFIRWQIYNDVAIAIFEALVIVQILYTIYGLFIINQYKSELLEYEESESETYTFDDSDTIINPAYKYTWIPKPAEPIS